MDLKVTYTGFNTKLDKQITKFFESIGFEWTGQGIKTDSQKRDITFKKFKKNDQKGKRVKQND